MMPGNFMEQLQAMKEKVEASKKKLDDTIIPGNSPQNKVTVEVTGNRKVKSIKISGSLSSFENEELEDHLMIALNDALEKAEKVHENEMKGAAGSMLGGI